jgi:hypothetical protein
VALAIACFELA